MNRQAGERGFILLIVLWTMVLLGLIGTRLVAEARGEAAVALGARAAATLEAAADGGVNAAIFHLLSQDWQADQQPHDTGFGQVGLTTVITNEAGRINPNSSPKILMQALLHVLGLDSGHADELATAMIMWRTRADSVAPQYQQAGLAYGPSGAPFQSLDELGLVLGLTADLLARLKPHLSLYQDGDVDRRFADPIVAAALDQAGSAATPLQAVGIKINDLLVRISVTARMSGRRQFVRTAEARLFAQTQSDPAGYSILSWENE